MNIILYLLQIIQYQYKIISQLLNFICRYIPLKQWNFDDSHSPKYQKFKVDELPRIISYEQDWKWNDLIPYYEKQLMHYTKFMELKYPINRWLTISKQQPFVLNLSLITMIIKLAPFLLLIKPTLRFVELKAISGSSWMQPNVPSSVTGYPTIVVLDLVLTSFAPIVHQ